MSFRPWYPRFPSDYRARTAHLTALEDGVYTRALDEYYVTAKPLPIELKSLRRLLRLFTPQDKRALDSILQEFFTLQSDGYHNKRADEILMEQAEYRMQQSDRAKRRWDKERDATAYATAYPEGMPVHMPEICHPQPQLQPEPQPSTKSKPKRNGHDIAPPELPEWLPLLQWQGWIEARTKARKPPTNLALRQALTKLEQWRDQGHSPAQILMKSAMNNWADLFEPKP